MIEGIAYFAGSLLVAAGLYLVLRGSFPGWWRQRLLWPLVRVTPRVSHLQGWAAVALGISIIALVFTTVVSELLGAALVVFALAAYIGGVVLYLFSTWLSRRPAA